MILLNNLRNMAVKVLYMATTFFVTEPVFANVSSKAYLSPQPIKLTQESEQNRLASSKAQLIFDFRKYEQNNDPEKRFKVAGPRTGGGGNSCALGILRNTEALIETLNEMPFLLSASEFKILKEKASTALYYHTTTLVLDGEHKDAVNYPFYNSIIVTEAYCDKLESIISGTTMALLFHELLGLAKIDDSSYQRSKEFIKAYNNEESRIREGTSVFGSFAGDIPLETVRNLKDVSEKNAVCSKQALDIAKIMTKKLGGTKAKIFSIKSSEQYEPASNSFVEIESYYFDGNVKLNIDIEVYDCVFLNLRQIFED